MTTKKILLKNIHSYGNMTGNSVRGKGLEVLNEGKWLNTFYSCSKENIEKWLSNESLTLDDVYLTYVKYKKTQQEESTTIDLRQDKQYKDIRYLLDEIEFFETVSVSTIPTFIGYVSLSKYNSSLQSQKQLLIDLIELDGLTYYGEETYESEAEALEDNALEFTYHQGLEDYYYNGDYKLEWGEPFVTDKDEYLCDHIDARLVGCHHELPVGDFWCSDLSLAKDYFKEIDPKETIALYHRKGKDWYVGYSLSTTDNFITYIDDDGDLIEEEEVYTIILNENEELRNKFINWIDSSVKNLSVKGYICNELEIQENHFDYEVTADDKLFNLNIVDQYTFDQRITFAFEIEELIDWNNFSNYKNAVEKAYEKWLLNNMSEDKKILKYKHLQQLEKIAFNDEKELVYSKIADFSDDMLYAIKYKKEEYHFSLSELLNTTPKKFYLQICKQLSKRFFEKRDRNILIQKASTVFVSINNSHKSGNCVSGTSIWCTRFGINTNKIGAVRGDVILELDYSNFTKRAVLEAIHAHDLAS